EIAEVLSPTNPLGIKAGGEGGTTAAPAVVVSAIVDALRPYGVSNITMPATPYKIWRAIQDAKQSSGRESWGKDTVFTRSMVKRILIAALVLLAGPALAQQKPIT